MSNEDISVREKIVLAAIECIEKQGIHAVTTRSIAKEADVNIAAVNYYFGTKDNLINETLKQTLNHAIMDLNEDLHSAEDVKTALRNFLIYIMEGSLRYPNIVKANFYEPLMYNNYDALFIKKFNDYFRVFVEKASALSINISEDKFKLILMQMFGSVMFVSLMPDIFKSLSDLDFKTEAGIRAYIDSLLEAHLKI
ncbi:MAG: TetR family transcriptional regulator [Bacillota bacterium]|nr:TetR family transcriptional regulator [Bacillota bacterium]